MFSGTEFFGGFFFCIGGEEITLPGTTIITSGSTGILSFITCPTSPKIIGTASKSYLEFYFQMPFTLSRFWFPLILFLFMIRFKDSALPHCSLATIMAYLPSLITMVLTSPNTANNAGNPSASGLGRFLIL